MEKVRSDEVLHKAVLEEVFQLDEHWARASLAKELVAG